MLNDHSPGNTEDSVALAAGSRPANVSRAVRTVNLVFQPRILFPVAAVVLLVFAGPRLRTLLPSLHEHPQFQFETSTIKLTEKPEWIPGDFLAQVIERSQLPKRHSVLRPDWAIEIADAFESHPWVEGVNSVRALSSQRIEANLKFRRPVALVDVDGQLFPIDGQGVLLPGNDFSPHECEKYCPIQNVNHLPQGLVGEPWGDPAVSGAAAIAAALTPSEAEHQSPFWRDLGISAIEIPRQFESALPNNLTYWLVTENGSRVQWGRAPGNDHPGELSTAQKLGRLERYLHRLDDGSGPYLIDIRHWREISYEPLAAREDGERLN